MLSNTTKWVVGLGVVFTLILATNLIDRANFRWMSESVRTIYSDRLVAKGHVYDMRDILSDKQVALARQDPAYFAEHLADDAAQMDALLTSFAETQLTPTEKRELESLQRHYTALHALEVELADAPEGAFADPARREQLQTTHSQLEADLFALSRIQLEEGKREQAAASKTMGAIDRVTQIEIALLVAIGVLIVAMLVFGPRQTEDD